MALSRHSTPSFGSDHEFYHAIWDTLTALGVRVVERDRGLFVFAGHTGAKAGITAALSSDAATAKRVEEDIGRLRAEYEPNIIALVHVKISARFGKHIAQKYPDVSLVSFEELVSWLLAHKGFSRESTERTSAEGPATPRNAPANTIKANLDEIILAATSLVLMIDDKLEALREHKPNSDEAIAARDAAILGYEQLRAKVSELQRQVIAFRKSQKEQKDEKRVAKSAKTFGEGLADWWTKRHEVVMDKTADTGLILGAVSVLSLTGVNPNLAAGVAGALIGGKSVVDVLKGIFKKGHGG